MYNSPDMHCKKNYLQLKFQNVPGFRTSPSQPNKAASPVFSVAPQ